MVDLLARPIRLLALVLPLLAACETPEKKGEQVVQELVALLPGSYDNLAQSRLPGGEHAPLKLMIAPVDAPLVADHVFYVQETAADDARRVLAQRLYVVNASADPQSPVLAQFDFTEATRWRDGHLKRDLFRAMLPQDLRLRAGCELLFTRSDGGFKASNDPKQCRVAARGTGETLRAEQRFELDRDGLAILDIQRDVNGVVVQGSEADPWYRFIRRADAPW